jgi:hypothetical protein
MLQKALGTQADQIIIDLEDSVIPSEKASAREHVLEFLKILDTHKKLSIRINERISPEAKADLKLIRALRGSRIESVILPKIHTIEDLRYWNRRIPRALSFEVQIESALGLVIQLRVRLHALAVVLTHPPCQISLDAFQILIRDGSHQRLRGKDRENVFHHNENLILRRIRPRIDVQIAERPCRIQKNPAGI